MIEEQTINGLPKDWRWEVSSKILDIRDGTHDTPKYVQENGIPLITSKNLKENEIDFNKVSYISHEDHIEISKRSKVENGDILFAMIGTIGNPAIIKGDANFSIKNVGLFKKNEEVILSSFLVNFLRSKTFEKQLSDRKLLKGTTQRFIPLGNLRSIHIPVPPIEVQQQIVSKIEELFSELDKGIEELKTAQQQLKIYRQAVLKWAFEGKLTNKDVKDGELPERWEVVSLKDLKQFSIYGPRFSSKDYSSDGVAILRTTDISESGKVDWVNAPKLSLSEIEYEKYKLIKNDLLITRTGSIGTISVFNDNKRAIPGAFLIHYRLKEENNIWYIFYFLKSTVAQKHFKEHSFGVGRPNLNVPNIELLKIPLPSPDEQQQIVQEIESRLSVCDKIEETIADSLKQAEVLRQAILKNAFEGSLLETKN